MYKSDLNITAFILHFGDNSVTNQCLDTVLSAKRHCDKIVVIDASRNFSRRNDALFKVLPTSLVNPGFSRAMNFGAKSEGGEADIYCFLNNDTTVPAHFFRYVCDEFQSRLPNLGAIGPKIVYKANPDQIWSAGGRISLLKMAAVQMNQYKDSSSIEGSFETSFISGCVFCISRVAFDDINGWPEAYFFGGEEWEIAKRLMRNGWRLEICGDLVVEHDAHVDSGQGQSHSFDKLEFVLNGYLNRILFARRNYGNLVGGLYSYVLIIYLVVGVPLRWRSVGGKTSYLGKLRSALTLARAIIRHINVSYIEKQILENFATRRI